MKYSTLLFEIRNHVAHITLNRPDAANSITLELARELFDAALECDENRDVRAVLLSGAGKTFSAGGDLKTFAAQGDSLPRYIKEVTMNLHAAVSHFARMDPPVIAAVHGSAAGGGMSLAIGCDFVLAAESARFTMAYTRAGLTPDGSSSYFLPRIVGLRRAIELTLTNRLLSAAEAMQMGIVTRVVPDAALLTEADKFAIELASGATGALGAAKRLMHEGFNGTLETQMELESRLIAERSSSAEGREGVSAFLAKRQPRFGSR